MTDPVNLAAIESRSAQKQVNQNLAQQVGSKARLEEEMEEEFNPAAVEKEQARYNRFRPLEHRKKVPEGEQKIKAVSERGEEDLARNFYKRNKELPPDLLKSLRNSIKQGATAGEVLEEVNHLFKDPTLADEAMEYLEQVVDPEMQGTIREAREIHYNLKERLIIAGRNVDSAAKLFHKKGIGESPTDLRDLYRDITGNPRDHNTLFSELSEKYPFDQLQLVVAFLLKGMGFDLKKGPSIQEAELMRLMTEVKNLQSILWVFLFFKNRVQLMRMMFSQYGVPYAKILSFEKMAKEFIKLVEEKYPSVLKLLKQLEKMGLSDEVSKIVVLTQYRDAIRNLSPRLYKSLKHKQDLFLVILETLEDLEEEEEEDEDDESQKKKKK